MSSIDAGANVWSYVYPLLREGKLAECDDFLSAFARSIEAIPEAIDGSVIFSALAVTLPVKDDPRLPARRRLLKAAMEKFRAEGDKEAAERILGRLR